MSEISEKGIKLIKDLWRDISIDIMFTPKENARVSSRSVTALTDYIAELESERRWIPVSEWLPELYQDVLALVDDEIVCGSFYQDWEHGFYFSDGSSCMLVATHWMPLPELPVSEAAEK